MEKHTASSLAKQVKKQRQGHLTDQKLKLINSSLQELKQRVSTCELEASVPE